MADEKITDALQFWYKALQLNAWKTWVFYKTPSTEVGYGRLNCECPNLGEFLKSYTADLGDNEADGFDPDAKQPSSSDSESESECDDDVGSKRKASQNKKTQKRVKPVKNHAWRALKDEEWVKTFVERPGIRIYQLPHLQVQTCVTGLSNLRKELLAAFKLAKNMFGYSQKIFSGSPASILKYLVHNENMKHGLSNQLDPIVWEHYKTPKYESLCVLWTYCPLDHFSVIPCGHAPGETFKGKVTMACEANLVKIDPQWRKHLSNAAELSHKTHDIQVDTLTQQLLEASFPLKLVYVSAIGRVWHAKNLEVVRAKLMQRMCKIIEYPQNPEDGCESDYGSDEDDEDDETADEKNSKEQTLKLDIDNPPSLADLDKLCPQSDTLCPEWLQYISEGGCKMIECNRYSNDCTLCAKKQPKFQKEFANWNAFIAFKWNHLLTHGPLGANLALEKVPEWMQEYFNTTNKAIMPLQKQILIKLLGAGFRAFGFWEQGQWRKMLPMDYAIQQVNRQKELASLHEALSGDDSDDSDDSH